MAIAVIDRGSQYTHLIARRLREMNVRADVFSDPAQLTRDVLSRYGGIVLSGGPASVYDQGAPLIDRSLIESGMPVLGICYGMQEMAHVSGGRVQKGPIGEYGRGTIRVSERIPLFDGLSDEELVWLSHGDEVTEEGLPAGFRVVAKSAEGIAAAIANVERRLYGVQFHPEVTHTPNGRKILYNFAVACGDLFDWTGENRVEGAVNYIRETAGDRPVLVLASGGVDSTVLAVLTARALPQEQVYVVHIDNGLLRKDESAKVMETIRKAGIQNLSFGDYSGLFLDHLTSLVEPEQKRRSIARDFVKAWKSEAKKLGLDLSRTLLAQGTLYTDRIESGKGVGRHAAKIKTHHNVGSPEIDGMEKIEPNQWWYKDEVRQVGVVLGLPKDVVNRHPYPGPGAAIRIIGHPPHYPTPLKAEDLARIPGILRFDGSRPFVFGIVDDADEKMVREIAGGFGYDATILPVYTVGVQGDGRSYGQLVQLNGPPDWRKLREVGDLIPNTVRRVNRVVYVLKEDQRAERPLLPYTFDETTLAQWRGKDDIAMRALERAGYYDHVEQMPVVGYAGNEKPSFALRPVATDEFMTVAPAELPWDFLQRLAHKLMEDGGIERVTIDVTNKPPATTEWE